jgi:hypothetical protein
VCRPVARQASRPEPIRGSAGQQAASGQVSRGAPRRAPEVPLARQVTGLGRAGRPRGPRNRQRGGRQGGQAGLGHGGLAASAAPRLPGRRRAIAVRVGAVLAGGCAVVPVTDAQAPAAPAADAAPRRERPVRRGAAPGRGRGRVVVRPAPSVPAEAGWWRPASPRPWRHGAQTHARAWRWPQSRGGKRRWCGGHGVTTARAAPHGAHRAKPRRTACGTAASGSSRRWPVGAHPHPAGGRQRRGPSAAGWSVPPAWGPGSPGAGGPWRAQAQSRRLRHGPASRAARRSRGGGTRHDRHGPAGTRPGGARHPPAHGRRPRCARGTHRGPSSRPPSGPDPGR